MRRRAEAAITETVEFLRTLLAKYSPEVLNNFETGGKYMLQLKGKADMFSKKARDISSRYSEAISTAQPFSTQLAQSIQRIYPLTGEMSALIEDAKRELVGDIDRVPQLSAINARIREKVHMLFMTNLVREAAGIIENKQAEIRSELVKKFLAVMDMKEGSEFEKDLMKSANALFDEYLIKDGEECRFNTLIERFASGLVDTLILLPFAEYERLDKVRRTLPELFSLAVYYSMPERAGDEGIFEVRDFQEDRVKFFAAILAHEGQSGNTQDSSAESRPLKQSDIFAAKSILIDYFDRNAKAVGIGVNELPLDEWAGVFARTGKKFDAMPGHLVKALEAKFYKAGWETLSTKQRITSLDAAIRAYFVSEAPVKALALDELLASLHEKASGLKAKSIDDMLRILDEDIEILRDLTAKSVIRAIGLERAFISIIVKNINFIRHGITDSGEGSRKFDEWINMNVRKVMDSEFAAIDRYNMDSQTRKSIVAAIQQVLGSME